MSQEPGFYVLKPSTACNFNCSFCSAKFLKIKLHEHVPESLKNYIIEHKVRHLSISGGEPLMNPRSYFEDLISIMEQVNPDGYEIGITSNLSLWIKDPEKYDYLFKNPSVIVETSFQYGGERKDDKEFSEDRFIEIFNKFKERYNYPLSFIYVVSEENEQYVLRACELARRLNTKLSVIQQIPVGASKILYPKHKILDLYMNIIDAGYEDCIWNTQGIYDKNCPFVDDVNKCLTCSRVLYVGNDEQVHEECCDLMIARNEEIPMSNRETISSKCFGCKMLRLCNGCPIQTKYTKQIADTHCKWMKDNYNRLKEHNFI